MCDQLAWNLNREFGASAIHGDKKQQERDFVLAAFKVCTRPRCLLHVRLSNLLVCLPNWRRHTPCIELRVLGV